MTGSAPGSNREPCNAARCYLFEITLGVVATTEEDAREAVIEILDHPANAGASWVLNGVEDAD